MSFTWNEPRTVQKQSPERVITNEKMSSKQVVQNPNRISMEQIIAAMCVCVGELCEIAEAQARAEAAKFEMTKRSLAATHEGESHGRERKPRKRTDTTEPTT